VAVRADDYGRDPATGRLAAAASDRVVRAREDVGLGLIHVHFPRAGSLLAEA
jgi:hypothetical protein